jgi:two-component system, response regulator PdtaR
MNENVDVASADRKSPGNSRKIATAPAVSNSASARAELRAVGPTLFAGVTVLEQGGRERGGKSVKALRILVVEDDLMIGGLLAETLEDLGHTVCAVETKVANAGAAAARYHPDLMIVDVGLGEASGIAMVKEILKGGFVPHVFVTADVLRDLSLGPDAVLIQKPFREPDIVQAIQRALSGGTAFRKCERPGDGPRSKSLAAAPALDPD